MSGAAISRSPIPPHSPIRTTTLFVKTEPQVRLKLTLLCNESFYSYESQGPRPLESVGNKAALEENWELL